MTWLPRGTGWSFVPANEDLDRYIKLVCIPRDEEGGLVLQDVSGLYPHKILAIFLPCTNLVQFAHFSNQIGAGYS